MNQRPLGYYSGARIVLYKCSLFSVYHFYIFSLHRCTLPQCNCKMQTVPLTELQCEAYNCQATFQRIPRQKAFSYTELHNSPKEAKDHLLFFCPSNPFTKWICTIAPGSHQRNNSLQKTRRSQRMDGSNKQTATTGSPPCRCSRAGFG